MTDARPDETTKLTILREPRVYLVGRQMIDSAEVDRFLGDHEVSQWTTDTEQAGEKLVEIAGRLCYMSFAKPRPGGNHAYIEHILEVGHGSVLEHAVFSLIITGVSRSFTHELVRHRAGFGYSQLSQRFVDESDASFVEPDPIADIPDRTLRRKKAREAARSILPNATETKIFVTGNARALRHFIEMRGDAAADAEIRKVALATLRVLQADSPNLFGDYRIVDLPEGGQAVATPFKKV